MVFCDLATPKGRGPGGDDPPTRLTASVLEIGEEGAPEVETAEERWLSNFVYYEIRDGLVAQGIPRDQIAFIHDAATKAQRDALFAAMNDGRVRVLIGSTGKMSTGMNVQRRLVALHNLDCPWRPGDLEQRHGRILRQGNQWPEVYVLSYITEGSFDSYMWQTIESKARFIEQALAGEITARTVEDTSEVVLSAAEIKAIASGNPQVVRKVQLEAEVARLDRVRAVWLDTRRNLRVERGQVEDEIRRAERRRGQWSQAQAITAAHPHEPFSAAVQTAVGSERFQPFTVRAEAGAAVRKVVHDYQSAAAFQRQRLRGVVARYRGLDLVVQAHAAFAADLSLALPDGTTLDAISATTDSGLWQSVSHLIGEIPAILERVQARIAQAQERIATIDRELARLEEWDGQERYDAAASELRAISAAFAAAEEQASGEHPQAAPTAEVPPPPDDTTLAEILLALAQEERTRDGCDEPLVIIPPAPASLAWMAAQAEQVAAVQPAIPVAIPALPAPLPATRHRPIVHVPTHNESFQQLSLFS